MCLFLVFVWQFLYLKHFIKKLAKQEYLLNILLISKPMPKNLINTTETVKIPKIDLKDRKIIRELDMNARMGIKELAKRVGLSRQVVQYRLERMKKRDCY